MNTCYLILGGNIGDKARILEKAIDQVEQKLDARATKSSIYVTAAWGNENQPEFYNQVIKIETNFSATAVLKTVLEIEESLGRKRNSEKWQERTIDIDILFYNDAIIEFPDLRIPHPFIPERKFVLVPMNEIASEFIHPVLKKSIKQLLDECKDELEVKIKL